MIISAIRLWLEVDFNLTRLFYFIVVPSRTGVVRSLAKDDVSSRPDHCNSNINTVLLTP